MRARYIFAPLKYHKHALYGILALYSFNPNLNSYGAIVAQERRKAGCRDYATRRVSTERAKPPANEAKYSTNKGLFMYGLSPLLSV